MSCRECRWSERIRSGLGGGGLRAFDRYERAGLPRVARDHRVHLVGYGPSASTIGANRAVRGAVREIRELLHTEHRVSSGAVTVTE